MFSYLWLLKYFFLLGNAFWMSYIKADEIDMYAALSDDAKCVLCQRNFSGKDKLKRHLSEKHVLNRVRYQCDICLKYFCRQDYVNIHKRSIHGVFMR